MGLLTWLIVIFIIIVIIVVAFIIIVIVVAGKNFLDCIESPFVCIFGGKNRQSGTVCLSSTACASGICKVGRCMNSGGTLNPGDKCTAGTGTCPKGYCCGGIPITCRKNDPNARQPGTMCTNCRQCASGNCIQQTINLCADENGKLPSGSRCRTVSKCAEFCTSGAGVRSRARLECT